MLLAPSWGPPGRYISRGLRPNSCRRCLCCSAPAVPCSSQCRPALASLASTRSRLSCWEKRQ